MVVTCNIKVNTLVQIRLYICIIDIQQFKALAKIDSHSAISKTQFKESCLNEAINESNLEPKKIGLNIGLRYGILKSFMNLKSTSRALFEYDKYKTFTQNVQLYNFLKVLFWKLQETFISLRLWLTSKGTDLINNKTLKRNWRTLLEFYLPNWN